MASQAHVPGKGAAPSGRHWAISGTAIPRRYQNTVHRGIRRAGVPKVVLRLGAICLAVGLVAFSVVVFPSRLVAAATDTVTSCSG